MKKAISILLSVILVFSCVSFSSMPVNAITDYTTGETEDGIFYRIDNETGELTVTWADFNTTDLVIPAYIDGKPVTTIGDNFLCDTPNPNLRSVVIPDTVKNIRFNAFANCINLESVVMSENIEYVEDCVFFNTALTNDESNWDNGSLYIGKLLYGVSTDYSGEFVIKDGTRVIGSNCFCSRYSGKGCEKITNIVIPDSVVSIGVFSFYNCISLTSIDIPDSVKYIDNVAFSQCINLSTININTSNLTYVGQNILRETAYYHNSSNWQDDVLYLNTAALCGKDDIEDLVIKEGTEIIADYAFGCKSGVSSASLPNSLRIICDLAFDDLHALPSIELPDGVEYIGKSAFDGCDLLTELDIPSSVNYIGLFAFNRTDNLEKLIIRNPECTIIDNHEEYAGGAYSVNPNTTVYGYTGSTAEVFANNNGVNFAEIPVTSGTTGDCTWTLDEKGTLIISGNGTMGNYDTKTSGGTLITRAPWGTNIKSVFIENGVTSIGVWAFGGCIYLTNVIIPDSVTSIGKNAFSGCKGLTNFTIPDSVNGIGIGTFAQCTGLTSISIPNGVTKIGKSAFYGCTGLKSVTIPDSVKYIEESAFSNCSSLTCITLPDSVTIISERAFFGCTSLTSVTIPDGVTTIDESAFYGCIGLTSVTIPDSVKYIEQSAFSSCSSLTCITLPDSVMLIDDYAFGYYYDNYYKKIDGFTIRGKHGSKAQQYADNNGFIFEAGEECPHCQSFLFSEQVITDVAVPATCTETGLTKGSHCSVCGEVLTAQEIVPATGHTPVIDAAKTPTCTETGLTEGSHCSVCGIVITAQETIPANGHKIAIDDAVPATCTHTGLTSGAHCSVCGETLVEQQVVSMKDHTVVIDNTKSPTCTKTGLTEGSHCSVCGEIIKAQEIIPANGHTPVKDNAVPADCTHTGLTEGSHCSVCGEVLQAQEVIPTSGHTAVTDKGYPATCTETGLTEGSHCSVCHEILKAQEVIPANGHTWNNGVVTTPASCHAEGVMTYTCTKCNATKTEPISRLEHVWNDGVITKEPTYTDTGEVLYTCTLCGDKHTETIPCKEKKGKLTITDAIVRAGDEVQVKLFLDENPGITALSIDVTFPEYFTLKNVQYTDLFGNQPSNSPFTKNPFTISWASSSTSDVNSTGLFAILTFEVDLSTPVDDYPITISYNANNIFDSSLINVPFDIENGVVTALKPTPGDVNRDM